MPGLRNCTASLVAGNVFKGLAVTARVLMLLPKVQRQKEVVLAEE